MRTLNRTQCLALIATLCMFQACSGDNDAATDSSDASDAVTSQDATDSTDATDSADQTDVDDGSDATDGVDGADGNDSDDAADGEDAINQLVAEKVATLAGATVHQSALAASGDRIAWCDGNTVNSQASNDTEEITTTTLAAECVAVVLDGETPIVVTADGKWIRDPGGEATTVDGPRVQRLRLIDGKLYGAQGTSQIASAAAELTSNVELLDTDEDGIRDVTLLDGDWILALGTGGVKRISPEGITMGWYTTEPSMANAVSITEDGKVVAAIAGTGMAILDPTGLQELSTTQARGVSLDITVGQGDLRDYAMVADWRRAQLVNLSDPEAATPIVRKEFRYGTDSSRVISVVATDSGFAVIGLNHVSRLTTRTGAPQPQLYIDQRRRQLAIDEEIGLGAVGIVVFNDGDAPLTVSNFQTDSERLIPASVPDEIGAFNVEFFQIDVEGSEPLDATFSFDTNDPDNPTLTYEVKVNPALLSVGDPAPDFVVPTTDGGFSMLSRAKGQVLYLKFFNAL